MTQILTALPRNARVGIIRMRSLGDCVLTTPAIAILKSFRPDLRLAVIVEPRFAAIFQGNPDVSRVFQPGLRHIALWRPHLVLNLHGGTRSMVLTAASRAKWRAGFAHHSASWLYNLPIPRAQEILGVDRTVHTAEHLASAMFYLGAPLEPVPRARLFAPDSSRHGEYAVIHPISVAPAKTWPAANFLAVADALDQRGMKPIFLGSPTDDLSPFNRFEVQKGTLHDAKCLLAGASLFLGNDSGPAHMAAAFGVPSVVLFGPSDPIVWAPWRVEYRIFSGAPISSIAVEEVSAALERLGLRK